LGHVGIYIGNNEFVHASSKGKVIRVDNLDAPYYQKRFQRAVRVKGLDNNGV
jgi:cell wall-associated NlpC family hydrolase